MNEQSKRGLVTTGQVKWFNDVKGFGFITVDEYPEKDIFVHFSVIGQDGFKSLHEGQMVNCEVHEGPKGLYATNVTAISTLN